jgi:hypothetical protein
VVGFALVVWRGVSYIPVTHSAGITVASAWGFSGYWISTLTTFIGPFVGGDLD